MSFRKIVLILQAKKLVIFTQDLSREKYQE